MDGASLGELGNERDPHLQSQTLDLTLKRIRIILTLRRNISTDFVSAFRERRVSFEFISKLGIKVSPSHLHFEIHFILIHVFFIVIFILILISSLSTSSFSSLFYNFFCHLSSVSYFLPFCCLILIFISIWIIFIIICLQILLPISFTLLFPHILLSSF